MPSTLIQMPDGKRTLLELILSSGAAHEAHHGGQISYLKGSRSINIPIGSSQMRNRLMLPGLLLLFLVACQTTLPEALTTNTTATTPATIPSQSDSLEPTLSLLEQTILAEVAASYGSSFYSSRADCVQAIDNRTMTYCAFPTGFERITMPEWEQLFPDIPFHIVDISGWRSSEHLLEHETEDSGTARHLLASQNGRAYQAESFGRLLETNAITITDANRELVARSFALMSIPNYLPGEIRFLSWQAVPPGTYRQGSFAPKIGFILGPSSLPFRRGATFRPTVVTQTVGPRKFIPALNAWKTICEN